MKKRTVLAILTALTITAGIFAGCGSSADTVPAGNMTNETGSVLEEDESLKDKAAEKKQADSDQKNTKTPSAEKTADEKEAGAKTESKDATPVEAPAKPADNGTKSDGNNNAGNTQAKPDTKTGSKSSGGNSGNSSSGNGNSGSDSAGGSGNSSSGSTSGSENSGSDSAGGSGNSGSAPAAQPEAPAHEHVWQEHTATRQEWVPNIVVVDDYQTQQVIVGFYFECNCGATFQPNDPAFDEHLMNHVLAGEPSNTWTVDKYEEQQVKVGSHEEDHGHYETVTYVDYYYCDCGATK